MSWLAGSVMRALNAAFVGTLLRGEFSAPEKAVMDTIAPGAGRFGNVSQNAKHASQTKQIRVANRAKRITKVRHLARLSIIKKICV